MPSFCEVKIGWTGNDANRFGTIASQMPAQYGSLYIHKVSGYNPCAIEFIPYNSGSRYSRNFDFVNADHLSEWINTNEELSKKISKFASAKLNLLKSQ